MAIGWPINGVADINTYRKQAKNHKDYSNNLQKLIFIINVTINIQKF